MLRKHLLLVVAVLAPFALLAPACGTDAVGVDACRRIEEARCARAPFCADIDLSRPVHRDAPAQDVAACVRHYREACLHGMVRPDEPSPGDVQACVKAIQEGDCDTVKTPERAAGCAWLVPPAPAPAPVEAAADASGEGG